MENRETDLLLRESPTDRPKWNNPDSVLMFTFRLRGSDMRGRSGITVSINVCVCGMTHTSVWGGGGGVLKPLGWFENYNAQLKLRKNMDSKWRSVNSFARMGPGLKLGSPGQS